MDNTEKGNQFSLLAYFAALAPGAPEWYEGLPKRPFATWTIGGRTPTKDEEREFKEAMAVYTFELLDREARWKFEFATKMIRRYAELEPTYILNVSPDATQQQSHKPKLLSLSDMADRFCTVRRTTGIKWLENEAEAGNIPCLKICKKLFFNPDAVEAVLASRAADSYITPIIPEKAGK